MSEALSAEVANIKSNIADASSAGAGDILAILEHSVEHLLAAAKHTNPDYPAVEAELNAAVKEILTYAFSLLPKWSIISFLEPQLEALAAHQIDVFLHKATAA